MKEGFGGKKANFAADDVIPPICFSPSLSLTHENSCLGEGVFYLFFFAADAVLW